MEWSQDMSAGHRQRGPQEGHSTMEEGEEMRDEENEERTREFKWHEKGRKRQAKMRWGNKDEKYNEENGGVYQYVFVVFTIM